MTQPDDPDEPEADEERRKIDLQAIADAIESDGTFSANPEGD
ncbi:hypothetical protein [Mycolicibacterium stellerae]|nr:hypothetical protein [Mycolicibacterium stellerae]